MHSEAWSRKQKEFILNSNAKFNLAHGSVRSGKTVCTLFRFMQLAANCPGDQIWMIGHTQDTIYHNCIRLLFDKNSPHFSAFEMFCTWMPGKRELKFGDKTIFCLGARDESSIGPIQGKTFDLCYCNEMTLYPENVIQMISTRLSMPHSMLLADMNPVQPAHICKKWIDLAEQGDKNYYSNHFTLNDNPYLTEEFKAMQRQTLTGLFYRRNYLGEWCLAEGAIFDFFDRNIHLEKRPKRPQEFWIAGIDYGTTNAFACVLIGVNTGQYTQEGGYLWVEKEYYYDSKNTRSKAPSEFARDMVAFLGDYSVRAVYVDPSAASFRAELRKSGIHTVDADNDVYDGILVMTNLMKEGNLTINPACNNLIREIEGYVWDPKKSKIGEDAPLKQNDHCFCEDTRIKTISGPKPIEMITPGDLVYTRKGLKKVLNTGKSFKTAFEFDLYQIIFQCTEDHKFYTENGWKDIGLLIQSDILYTSENLWANMDHAKWLSSMDESTDAIQSLKDFMQGITSQEMENISIERFGSFIMDRFPKDIIFITKTGTPLTMIYPICNALPQGNMSDCMNVILGQIISQKKLERLPLDGINQNVEENGIENTLKKCDLENGNSVPFLAKSAEQNTPPQKDRNQDFVRIIVNRSRGENLVLMMSLQLAKDVARNIHLININQVDTARPLAKRRLIGKRCVYNLEIDECSEFFAEGFLVHNSVDALRYAVKSYMKGRTSLRTPGKPDDPDFGRGLGSNPVNRPITPNLGHGFQAWR